MLTWTRRVPWWWQLVLAIVSAAAATWLTLLLRLRERPFLLPIIAVLVTSLRAGLGAGLTCTIAAAVLTNYFVAPGDGRLGVGTLAEFYEFLVFGTIAAAIVVLAARGRRSQVTLEATLASIGDGVIVSDRSGRVQFLNDVAQRLTGWTMTDAEGAPVSDVFVARAEDADGGAAMPFARALDDLPTTHGHALLTLVNRGGRELPIATTAAPIRDLDDRLLGTVLVFRDASAQRDAELELRRQALERLDLLERERLARSEAERANRLKDEFLATLSHELRTPLNAVLGWSHMLTRRQLTGEQQKQALSAIHRNAQAQARLVEDVLDLSRIVTGRMALVSEPVNLVEIARSTAESFAPAVMARRQELRLDLPESAEVTGDPHRLRQILWNLLSNATKFTPDGGTIVVGARTTVGRVEVWVTDTGEGIDPAFMPFVFDRFRQGDSSSTRGHGGLGLGLALVRHLAEAHGGSARVESAGPGRGTTATVSLPARVASSAAGRPLQTVAT